MPSAVYLWASGLLLCVALGATVFGVALSTTAASTRHGLRGVKRARALQPGRPYALVYPIVRTLGAWIALVPLGARRARIEALLKHAGDWLGVTADELIALSLVSCLGAVGVGAIGMQTAELPGVLLAFFGGLGAVLPYIAVTGEVARRQKQINRALPAAIDLAALCMSAGLDFPGALRQIVTKAGAEDDPLNEELELVLTLLNLGYTRRAALEGLADRVPAEAVRDFVSAVVQSEEKGTPLAEVLTIQANVLRVRRTVAGEEAASRAALLMMVPLMLIFACIILVLLGPFLIRGMESGI